MAKSQCVLVLEQAFDGILRHKNFLSLCDTLRKVNPFNERLTNFLRNKKIYQ